MIKFLTKGILRDRSRSLFPVIVVTLTVAMIVLFQGFLTGIMNGMFLDSAVVSTGHVKIMTKAYHEENQLLPNDLALLDTEKLVRELNQEYPDYFWTPRITFGGLLDVPDENGETHAQGPVYALGIDFLSLDSRQIEIWKLERRLVTGRLPENANGHGGITEIHHGTHLVGIPKGHHDWAKNIGAILMVDIVFRTHGNSGLIFIIK